MQENEIKKHDFTTKEMQWFTALAGMCSVCGCAAFLGNGWALLGLLPVWGIVVAMKKND